VDDPPIPLLTGDDLIRLAHHGGAGRPCASCAALVCPGWESLAGGFDRNCLRRVGTLRAPGDDEPTLQEHHPAGTHAWSADAPIAQAFFPYNRCEVWQCVACARAFLRYTEYGGYYVDERIRALDPTLVVNATPQSDT
jgi:hypothetical protein